MFRASPRADSARPFSPFAIPAAPAISAVPAPLVAALRMLGPVFARLCSALFRRTSLPRRVCRGTLLPVLLSALSVLSVGALLLSVLSAAVLVAAAAFAALADEDGLIFMVGDGNHSLATAKASWDKIKANLSEEEKRDHPARYALVEAVNLYDGGIRFEAIHRIVKGVAPEKFSAGFPREGEGEAFLVVGGQKIACPLGTDAAAAVEKADRYIARYLAENGGEVDYIHGAEEVERLSRQEGCVGVLLPKMDKSALFAAVKRHGCLPRKTFSMGESAEKRYYIEGKEIVKK